MKIWRHIKSFNNNKVLLVRQKCFIVEQELDRDLCFLVLVTDLPHVMNENQSYLLHVFFIIHLVDCTFGKRFPKIDRENKCQWPKTCVPNSIPFGFRKHLTISQQLLSRVLPFACRQVQSIFWCRNAMIVKCDIWPYTDTVECHVSEIARNRKINPVIMRCSHFCFPNDVFKTFVCETKLP